MSNGTDDFGFSAFPDGMRYETWFQDLGNSAWFWTITESSTYPTAARDYHIYSQIRSDEYNKKHAFSVRLVKDT